MQVLLAILLLQHAVISARAGLITYAENVTAAVDAHMETGRTVESGPGSRFEAMLGSDTYVRTRGRAAIVLESEALDDTRLRVVEGMAIVDARNIDPEIPIRVLVGELEYAIGHDGLYLFEARRVVVLDGELEVRDPDGRFDGARLGADRALIRRPPDGVLDEVRLDEPDAIENLPLVRWSRQRTARLTPEPVFRRGRPGVNRRFRF